MMARATPHPGPLPQGERERKAPSPCGRGLGEGVRRGWLHAVAILLLSLSTAHATPPPDRLAILQRGVNLTNWFRYPARQDAAAIRTYMSDAAMADLHRAGFTYVRLPVQPEFLLGATAERTALLGEAVARLQRQGLGVVVELHPTTWHLETSAADRERLVSTWRLIAPVLAKLDPKLTFPEIVNEPVFSDDMAGWEALQQQVLAVIRPALPAYTIVLTGNDWSSLDGLLRLHPVADADVVYAFHFYEPSVLTTLAEFDSSLDKSALATLPFPVSQPCVRTNATGRTLAVMRYYCSQPSDEAALDERIALAADWSRRNHAVVIAGEFGATSQLNAPARLAWLGAVRRALEGQHLGWALWGYDDRMGFGVARPPSGRPVLNPDVLRALGLHPPG